MKSPLFTSLLAFCLAASAALAQQPAKPDQRADISRKFPGTTADDVRQSPVSGVFEVMRGTDVVYVSADAKYAIAGDLYELNDQNSNLSERRRREVRARLINAVPDSQTLVFAPKTPKYTVTVFTDVDCGYCRQLHSQIARYNDLGIKVRYLFFPRSGPDSEGWTKAEQVWCAPNRNEALTKAKRGEDLKIAKCAKNPVERDYELGQDIGLRGTPGIVLSNGELLPGYVPPVNLVARLQNLTAGRQTAAP
jgi:thiol:disulfide interchange protein DsbC